MNRAMTAPVLEPVGEGRVALQSVNVEAEIENLLCQVTVKQRYRNLEKVTIEAVYTFPLPLEAVLLDMTIQTRTKVLKGVVVQKSEAEERYEDAITEGDTAIMLEQVDPGLYTMNVGNLQPEETIDISITYAELFKWRDNSLRFFLPTTIAPRYGAPGSLGIQPHQAPEYDLTNENRFSIRLSIFGALARASIESPSHKIVSGFRDGRTEVSLKRGQALMDRDFVLNLRMDTDEKSVAHVEPDEEGQVVLASFYPRFPSRPERAPRCITIVLDCSGSMAGDAIAQARKALHEIIELLEPEDMFNIVRFGSAYRMLFPAPVFADAGNLKKGKDLLKVLDADMGGTEIGQAIAAAVQKDMPAGLSHAVLLITDGEVWDWENVTNTAARSGVRFFTVGVGSAVSEAFVQSLADVTGGACELVSPNENMAEKIVRHFKRIFFPKAGNVTIRWPVEPDKTFPEQLRTVYDGDTLHVFGRFGKSPKGEVELRADLESGGTFVQRLAIKSRTNAQTPAGSPGTTARMAAMSEIRAMEDPREIAALAVKYQLMSRFTNYLAVDVKADGEKAGDLPALRKTPQMLAAGWGAAGTVRMGMGVRSRMAMPMMLKRSLPAVSAPLSSYGIDGLEDAEQEKPDRSTGRPGWLHAGLFASFSDVASIGELEDRGVPQGLIDALTELVDCGADEETVVTLFLCLLSQHERLKKNLDRSTRRALAKACKQLPGVPGDVRQRIEAAIATHLQTNRS